MCYYQMVVYQNYASTISCILLPPVFRVDWILAPSSLDVPRCSASDVHIINIVLDYLQAL